MKHRLWDIAYFIFFWILYVFLKKHSQETVFEIFSCSYLMFFQLLDRFSIIMSLNGWKRLF